jgi:hypothetical protein
LAELLLRSAAVLGRDAGTVSPAVEGEQRCYRRAAVVTVVLAAEVLGWSGAAEGDRREIRRLR